jgi:hypothetical protein
MAGFFLCMGFDVFICVGFAEISSMCVFGVLNTALQSKHLHECKKTGLKSATKAQNTHPNNSTPELR